MTLSLTCAQMCALTYEHVEKTVKVNETFFETMVFGVENAAGIVFENDRFVIIAFRGTDDVKDMCSDIRIAPSPFKNAGMVHSGFLSEYQKVKPVVESVVLGTRKQIIFTGHSLGGSIAYLAACDFIDQRPLVVVTFGMPRTAAYQFIINPLFSHLTVLRWINSRDAVVRLPSLRFTHCGSARTLDDERGKLARLFHRRAYHKIKHYVKALENKKDLILLPYEKILF